MLRTQLNARKQKLKNPREKNLHEIKIKIEIKKITEKELCLVLKQIEKNQL